MRRRRGAGGAAGKQGAGGRGGQESGEAGACGDVAVHVVPRLCGAVLSPTGTLALERVAVFGSGACSSRMARVGHGLVGRSLFDQLSNLDVLRPDGMGCTVESIPRGDSCPRHVQLGTLARAASATLTTHDAKLRAF